MARLGGGCIGQSAACDDQGAVEAVVGAEGDEAFVFEPVAVVLDAGDVVGFGAVLRVVVAEAEGVSVDVRAHPVPGGFPVG